jgi:prefoldin subunit 5
MTFYDDDGNSSSLTQVLQNEVQFLRSQIVELASEIDRLKQLLSETSVSQNFPLEN